MKTTVTVNAMVEVVNVGTWSHSTTLDQIMKHAKKEAVLKLNTHLEKCVDVKWVGEPKVMIRVEE